MRRSVIRDVTIRDPLNRAELYRVIGAALSVKPSDIRSVEGTGDHPVLLEVRETHGEYRRQVRAYIDETRMVAPTSDRVLALKLARILQTSVLASTDDGVPGRYYRVEPTGEARIVETDEDEEDAGRVDVNYESPYVYSPTELGLRD